MECRNKQSFLMLVALVGMFMLVGQGWAVDIDGDGVDDANDLCPSTPAGMAVEADGCRVWQKFVLVVDTPSWVISRGTHPNHSLTYHPEVAFDMDVRLDSPGGSVQNASASIAVGNYFLNLFEAASLRAYNDGHVEMWDLGDVAYWQSVHDALDPEDPCALGTGAES